MSTNKKSNKFPRIPEQFGDKSEMDFRGLLAVWVNGQDGGGLGFRVRCSNAAPLFLRMREHQVIPWVSSALVSPRHG